MKKTTVPIVVFYVIYFVWIFTFTYLTAQTRILNYFSLGVLVFYFLLLREKGDINWFILASLIPVIITITSFKDGLPNFNLGLLLYMPLWLPMAWGTTVVALRKFYLVVSKINI